MNGSDQLNADQADLTGQIIAGKYQVLDFLARGGGGSIYRAVQLQIGREVVLKILHLNPSLFEVDPHFATRFRREAATYGRLRHPNTVTLFDYGEHEHQGTTLYFMVLEYVRGKTLRQLLRQHTRLPADRAVAIVQEVLRSLREAHKLGIVHRDLKPSNIMLVDTEEGERVKVLDFGVAKVEIIEDASVDALTRTGTVIGSPHYMAPEQVRSLKVDARADIYALGAILFEMLAGVPPFGGDGVIEICAAHLTKPVPTIASKAGRPSFGGPEVPPELEAVLRRCLEKEPERRYQSADELLGALKAFRPATEPISIERSLGSLTVPPPLESEPRRWHPALWVTVGILLASLPTAALAGLAVLGLLWLRPPGETPKTDPGSAEAPEPVPGEVTEEVPEELPAEAPAVFRVRSEPPGALVSCDGEALGRTPLELEKLAVEALTCKALILELGGHRNAKLSLGALRAEPDSLVHLTKNPKSPDPQPFVPDLRFER